MRCRRHLYIFSVKIVGLRHLPQSDIAAAVGRGQAGAIRREGQDGNIISARGNRRNRLVSCCVPDQDGAAAGGCQ